MGIETTYFGKTKNGEQASLYRLYNDHMEFTVTDFGACLVNVWFRDKRGRYQDIVWGYDTLEEYEINGPSFGGTIGRNANRIGQASVKISEKVYELEQNDGTNNLHGGNPGYHRRMWEAWTDVEDGEPTVTFILKSPHMDQGFPGKARVSVSYTLTEDNRIRIEYKASADEDTIFNMTNHSYFNLEGQASDSVMDHEVIIESDAFTPINEKMLPTGEVCSVEGTPLDFRTIHKIGERIFDDTCEQLKIASGYDHNWILRDGQEFAKAAYVYSEKSGIEMEVWTDTPGVQMYTANFLLDEKGKDDVIYKKRSAVCFETQFYPDTNHHDNFPTTIVKANEKYHSVTEYRLSRKW